MSTLIGRLLPAAFRRLQALSGVSILYHVHDELSVEVCAAVRTRPRITRSDVIDGIGFDAQRWDWLIAPGELVNPAGELITPAQGHWIERQSDGLIHLVTPDPNNSCWRYSDDTHIWRRIYTQEQTRQS